MELLFDYPRLEERLIIERLKGRGIDVTLTNVNDAPFTVGESPAEVSIVRPVAMFKAMYSAAVRESSGTYTVNSSATLFTCGDKVLCLSAVRRSGIRVPRTVVALDRRSAETTYKAMQKPFVDKPPIGSWGRLVALITDPITWRTVLEHRSMLSSAQLKVHLMQQYIDHGGRDIRTIVVGEQVLGAMERISPSDDWRTNVALGGKTVTRKLDDELVETSLRCAEIVRGDFIAVDLLQDRSGTYYVNELNGVPEFKGFMEATQIDVAGALASHVDSLLKR
ncbi:MAG: RimK family alpha-L-glutamate ligase [Candidatus Caldarchaeales archaeon]